MHRETELLEPIAIIGMACRFPGGANSPEELWQILEEGKSTWAEVPADRYAWKSFYHPNPDAETGHNQNGGGYIDRDLASFDAAFFGIPATEADGLDPQQRIHLETAYEALESAGLPMETVRGSKTSVHVATVSRDYDRNAYRDPQDLAKYQLTGCGEAITSGRVSYTFDLRGPCFSLDTGCSGSLVGVHLAVQSLRLKETDMALVGGTNLLVSPDMTIAMSKLHMLNNDGRCYAFDSRGNGYARSEGVSTIVLKRFSDAVEAGDPIRAIIRNTGLNQDGRTNGIMLPNPQAQEELMRSIHLGAGLDPGLTAYVEAHGTGTQAGDSAEISSISRVFCQGIERESPLMVGSVKANLGHCESASGLAGLIKTVLVLEKGMIPATPNVLKIKEGLNLAERNIRISQRLEKWPALGVRRAAINSFGYGGTNAAAILDSYEPSHSYGDVHDSTHPCGLTQPKDVHQIQNLEQTHEYGYLFVFSARSSRSLKDNLRNLKEWIISQPEMPLEKLGQLAYTLSERRSKLPARTSFVTNTVEGFISAASDALDRQWTKPTSRSKVIFVFTGQGAQWYAMGRELLYLHSSFADSLRESERILKELGAQWSLLEMLSRDQSTSRINESEISQPTTTALQIALVDLLSSFSVHPESVIGHSSGEIAAAYSVGALSRAAALRISFHRSKLSKLVQQAVNAPGGMIVTSLDEKRAQRYIESIGERRLSLACINSPSSTTISGDKDAIEELQRELENNNVMAKLLIVDVAYHSHHMKAVAAQYLNALQGTEDFDPRDDIQFFSSVTGEKKVSGFGPEYWVQNLVSTVRFTDALEASLDQRVGQSESKRSARVFIEIGPHSALAGPTKQILSHSKYPAEYTYLSALVRDKNSVITVYTLAGKLFELGVDVNIDAVNSMNGISDSKKMLLGLPTYAWDYSNKYWHESRLSKDYRFRKHPYHDLLGLRVIGSTPIQPSWRNILSVDALPWLAEHVIDGFAILPGSSFLTMAIEASRQLNSERGALKIKKFHLKNVKYFKAIMIPDSPKKVEVMMSFSSLNPVTIRKSPAWETFTIYSSSDAETWTVNCVGEINLEFENKLSKEFDGGQEELQTISDLNRILTQTRAACSESLDCGLVYEEMRRNGIDYGNHFATIKNLQIGDCQALGTVVIPNVADCLPSKYQQPHIIHPATFDALMHIVLPLYFRHCSNGTAMLTSIDEIVITENIATLPGTALEVCAALNPSGTRSGSVDVVAFQNNDWQPKPVVILRGQKFQGIAQNNSSSSTRRVSKPFHDSFLPLKMTVSTPGVASSICFTADETSTVPLEPDELELKALALALDATDVDVILGKTSNIRNIGECSGIITAVGSDLSNIFHVGDRVCAWNSSVAFASRPRVKGSFVQKIPDSWSFQTGAALPQNMTTVYFGLMDCAQIQPGQTMLVNNAGNPLGHAAVLLGNKLGLRVIATVKSKVEKETLGSVAGIQVSDILYSGEFSTVRSVFRSTDGVGVDVILNTPEAPLDSNFVQLVKAFGAIIDIHQERSCIAIEKKAIRYISLDSRLLLRHLPSKASTVFKAALSFLIDTRMEVSIPITEVSVSDAARAVKAVQEQKHAGKTVLLAAEDALVSVDEALSQTVNPLKIDRIIQAINELSIPQSQKETLLGLINDSKESESGMPSDTQESVHSKAGKVPIDRRLAGTRYLQEAIMIVSEELIRKISSLVSVDPDQLNYCDSLSDLGLDSLIAIDFKNWIGRTLGADIRVHDILDASSIEGLSEKVAQKSKFVPDGLTKEDTSHSSSVSLNSQTITPASSSDTDGSMDVESMNDTSFRERENSPLPLKMGAQGSSTPPEFSLADKEETSLIANTDACSCPLNGEELFEPNMCPKYPLPPLESILESYLMGVKAFATPREFEHTVNLVQEFSQPGSKGRTLYERAVERFSDPTCENWEHELQLRRGFLDRRNALSPWSNFWFSHPLSKHQHSQAERAALLTVATTRYYLKLRAGLIKPMVLNEQELTTAYHPYIFNSTREPHIDSDEIKRYSGASCCVVLYRGHAYRLNLLIENRVATFEEFLDAFETILKQDHARTHVGILTSDDRNSWAKTRQLLHEQSSENARNLATIEAAAFVVALDEGSPRSASERAKQFHFGGVVDASNRWQDKSIQFVVCSNGTSGIIGEHTMLDALTLNELLEQQAEAIHNYDPRGSRTISKKGELISLHLKFKLESRLIDHILKVQDEYADSTRDSEHAYLLLNDYGSVFLREHKLSPKSVFQMIVQLAASSTFGYMPPCWETVNQAHYHLGRVDIIQVVVPAVAAFIQAAGESSSSLPELHILLVNAIRAHVATMNKAGRNLGWERSLTALRALAKDKEELPDLYKDPVHNRVRPRLMMSNCFETGMMEKGCLWKDREAIWTHYEVYDHSVYFSVVTAEAGRATRFCENLKSASKLVKKIIVGT